MRLTTILLLDFNPRENTGETLESILAASPLEGALRREVVADPRQSNSDLDWLDQGPEFGAALIFIVLSAHEPSQGAALIETIKTQKPQIPIIAVIKDAHPAETLELLQKGASDFITPPLSAADTLPRTLRLLKQFGRRIILVRA